MLKRQEYDFVTVPPLTLTVRCTYILIKHSIFFGMAAMPLPLWFGYSMPGVAESDKKLKNIANV